MGPLQRAVDRYRATGADLPLGDPTRDHGVAMEGYFWRFTPRETPRHPVIALIGVNRPDAASAWATVGLADDLSGSVCTTELDDAYAAPDQALARSGESFLGTATTVRARFGSATLDVRLTELRTWPLSWRRPFGASSIFQLVPGLNQYWHPWILGGRAHGAIEIDGNRRELVDAEVYAEKNWGRGGFPDAWWWGQAQGFGDEACLAYAGGQIHAGPRLAGRPLLRTEVTALVAALPDGDLVRLGNPGTSPVSTEFHGDAARFRGRSARWRVEVEAQVPTAESFVLPVPLVWERRNAPSCLESLHGAMTVRVWRDGRLRWRGQTTAAGIERGSRTLAEQELARRGGDPRPVR